MPQLTSVLLPIQQAKSQGKTIVLVTGVFDIIHQEHISFLKNAKAAGNVLVIGIESDFRVKKIKGKGRPINSQKKRQQNLKDLKIADYIFILPQKFDQPANHENLIRSIKPDILAISSHSPHQDAKKRILKKYGGTVKIVHAQNPQFSTTNLINP